MRPLVESIEALSERSKNGNVNRKKRLELMNNELDYIQNECKNRARQVSELVDKLDANASNDNFLELVDYIIATTERLSSDYRLYATYLEFIKERFYNG